MLIIQTTKGFPSAWTNISQYYSSSQPNMAAANEDLRRQEEGSRQSDLKGLNHLMENVEKGTDVEIE